MKSTLNKESQVLKYIFTVKDKGRLPIHQTVNSSDGLQLETPASNILYIVHRPDD